MKSLPHPYVRLLRLHQPTGIFLLLLPIYWALALSNNTEQVLFTYFIFGLGAFVMRSAGCIINDIVDRKIDAKVERTKDRPLANGDIKLWQALALLCLLLLIALGLASFLPINAILFSCALIVPIIIYPFAKRFTNWPQLILGITFNAGIIVAWLTVETTISAIAVLLYISAIFWTLGYDTIYAHQDKIDDQKIGVRSTALTFNISTKKMVSLFYIISLACLWAVGILAKLNFVFYLGLLLGTMLLFWQVSTTNLDSPIRCMAAFKTNSIYGLIIFVACLNS